MTEKNIVETIQTALLRCMLGAEVSRTPIVRGLWGVHQEQDMWWVHDGLGVDALGAVLLCKQPQQKHYLNEMAAICEVLGVTPSWVLSFRSGFHAWTECDITQGYPYRLGAWFACEYIEGLLEEG